MIRIRDYEPEDFGELVLMGLRFHRESGFARFVYDPDHLKIIHDLVMSNEDWACFVAERDGEKIGMFVGAVQNFYFGPSRHAIDLLLFVEQNRRGSLAAARLLEHATVWAKARGAEQLRFGAATGIDPARSDKFFKGMGFEVGGTLYLKDL